MRKILLASMLGLALTATATASNFSVSGPGGALPDVSGTNTWNVTYAGVPFTSTVTVANPVTSITKVRLNGLNHTWRGDLHIFIRDPASTIYNIVVRPGSTGASVGDSGNYNVGNYEFVDAGGGTVAQGATNISGGVYNLYQNTGTGMWTLGAVNGPLSAITGPAGTWTLEIRDWAAGDVGSLTGWDLEGTDSSGSGPITICDPGAGGVMACPCGNAPAGANQGCANSLGAGASAAGSGNANLATDTLVITGSGIGSSGVSCAGSTGALTCILLQGNALSAGGTTFNDGVRCFAGSLKRLETATSSGGVFTSTVVISTTSSGLGDPIASGTKRWYGVWYRDPCASHGCVDVNSNVTNTVEANWL